LDGLDDAGVSSAPAEVVVHGFDDLLAAGAWIFQEKAVGREDHPRRAEPALQGIVLDEGRLKRVQGAVSGQAFDGDDLLILDVRDGILAGALGFVVDKDRAGAAKALAAPVLRSREFEIRAEDPEKHAVTVYLQAFRRSVELETDCLFHSVLLLFDPPRIQANRAGAMTPDFLFKGISMTMPEI
jgi:hypothetical protein